MSRLPVLALASFRLSHLIARDDITAGLRKELTPEPAQPAAEWPRALTSPPKQHDFAHRLIGCPTWCLPIWTSAVVVILDRFPRGRLAVDGLAAAALVVPLAQAAERTMTHRTYTGRTVDAIENAVGVQMMKAGG